MPKDVELPLFEYAKKQKLYHFDLDKPDGNDIIFKPKLIILNPDLQNSISKESTPECR